MKIIIDMPTPEITKAMQEKIEQLKMESPSLVGEDGYFIESPYDEHGKLIKTRKEITNDTD